MKLLANIFLLMLPCFCCAQKQGSVWVFGDSALVDYTDTSNFSTGLSQVKTRGSCVSVCDSLGHLLFYSFTRPGLPDNTARVYSSNNQLMQGGDSIVGEGWYHELVVIPFPDSDSLYYLFSIGVTGSSQTGLYYSIIDMSANGGQGAIIMKNQLLQSFKMVDCLTAVKHGNGRDWWILFRKSDYPTSSNAEYYEYLVTTSGISNIIVQTIGSQNSTNIGNISVNSAGSKFVFNNAGGLLELYDFDRCTGIISNPVNIHPEASASPFETYWGACFSPSDSILYVTKFPLSSADTSRLYQFDLTSTNILASEDTLWESLYSSQLGSLKRSLDGKIYLTTNYYGGFPYADSMYNNINMNLSIINSPDSLGTACNLTQNSFYLGGKRSYFGLPNNPDYFLGPVIGSGCDTILSIHVASQQVVISNLYPNPNNGTFTVNYFLPNGQPGLLEVFSMQGQKVFSQPLPRYSYIQEIRLKQLPSGIYAVGISSGDRLSIERFIIQYVK